MSTDRYVLDANIFTSLLRNEPIAVGRVTRALLADSDILVCPVVFYEICRGLLERDARRQLQDFKAFASTLLWDDFGYDDWWLAAEMWADNRRKGIQAGDADVLIAAFSVRRNAVLVTDNVRHFQPLGVVTEHWRR